MRADNSRHIIASARQRAAATRRRAIATLRRMEADGALVTFESVAREANVSRAWLYTQDDLRVEVARLRGLTVAAGPVPVRQRASDASLRRRLEAAVERNKRLESENRSLRDALGRALGERRISNITRAEIDG